MASKLTPDRLEAFLDELGAELDSYLVDQIKNLVDQLPPRKLAALYELLRETRLRASRESGKKSLNIPCSVR